jgi:hypothetical protein
MMKTGDRLSAYCQSCKKETTQEVLATFSHEDYKENGNWSLDLEVTTAFLQCGCNTACIKIEAVESNIEHVFEQLIPPAPARPMPNWINELPKEMADLLREVHLAFTLDQRWLVAMGARTLIDMFALERIGDKGGFQQKLQRLEREKYLSQTDVVVIESAVEVGHEATHRLTPPSQRECRQVLDIVENLLHRLVLANYGAELSESRAKKK